MKIERDTDIDPDAHVSVHARFSRAGDPMPIVENVTSSTATMVLHAIAAERIAQILSANPGASLTITPHAVELTAPNGFAASWWIA